MASTPVIPSTSGKFQKVVGVLQDSSGTDIGGDNSLPVQLVDGNQRTGTNTVFGDTVFGQRVPTLSAQFYYTLPGNVSTPVIVGSGTIDQNNAMLNVATGTDANGSAQLTSSQRLRYIPGYEAFAYFTGVFTTGVPDSFQREGLYDDNDGFFIGFEGTQFGFTRRRAGVDDFHELTTEELTLSDGTVIDPTKGNIYKISYGFLGFASISLEVMNSQGGLECVYKIAYPNSATVTHIQNTYLPLRVQCTNTGNTSSMGLSVGSVCAGIVDGAGADITGRVKAFPSPETSISNGTLMVYRNRLSFDSKDNGITARLKSVAAAADGNKPAKFTVYRDPTYTNVPTWTDVDTAGSIIEYSTDAIIDTANSTDVVDVLLLGRLDSLNKMIDELNLFLSPGQAFGIHVVSQTATDATIAYTWNEEF